MLEFGQAYVEAMARSEFHLEGGPDFRLPASDFNSVYTHFRTWQDAHKFQVDTKS